MKTLERPRSSPQPTRSRKAAPASQRRRQTTPPRRPRGTAWSTHVFGALAVGLSVCVLSMLAARTQQASAHRQMATARQEMSALRSEAAQQFEQIQLLVGPEATDRYAREMRWTYLGEPELVAEVTE